MKTLIINGFEDDFKLPYVLKIKKENNCESNDITTIGLANIKFNNCIGCDTCMFKTPGYCVFEDDVQNILKQWLGSDLILFFYTVKRGFMNYLTKKLIDRLFPLELPYIEFNNSQFTHPTRYKSNPDIGFIIDIIDMKYWQLNLENNHHIGNYYGKFLFQKSLSDYRREVKNETLYI